MIRPEWPAPANVVAGTSLIDTPDGALPDGICLDEAGGVRTDTELFDAEQPLPGAGWFYVISAESGGEEGTLPRPPPLAVLARVQHGGELLPGLDVRLRTHGRRSDHLCGRPGNPRALCDRGLAGDSGDTRERSRRERQAR